MEWCKAAHPTLSKWGDIVLSLWDVPNVVLPGAPCRGWPLTCGIACEGEELRLLISTARNLFVLWFFVPGLKLLLLVVAYQPAGPVRASACLAPQGLPHGSARQGAFLCVCLSVHPCSARGCSVGWFNLLGSEIISHIKPQSPQLAASSVWAWWGLAWLLHVKEWVGKRPSVLGASLRLLSALGQHRVCVSSHITGPSLWFPWPLIIQINNHNKSPCASLGK